MRTLAGVGKRNNLSAALADVILIFDFHNDSPLQYYGIYTHIQRKACVFYPFLGTDLVLQLENQCGTMNALPDSVPQPSATVTPQGTELSSVSCLFH